MLQYLLRANHPIGFIFSAKCGYYRRKPTLTDSQLFAGDRLQA